eukprot:2395320-Pyramimonas_sp.AAC.1
MKPKAKVKIDPESLFRQPILRERNIFSWSTTGRLGTPTSYPRRHSRSADPAGVREQTVGGFVKRNPRIIRSSNQMNASQKGYSPLAKNSIGETRSRLR